MKKGIIFLLTLILLAGAGFFGYRRFLKPTGQKSENRVVKSRDQLVNQLALKERPYLTLVPRDDGRELILTIDKLKLAEKAVEYQLEYQTGQMMQGAGGRIDLTKESTPVVKKILLGSCSAGGKCSYDEEISAGSLTLHFSGRENYSLKSEFTFNQAGEADNFFSSRNTKASLAVEDGQVDESAYIVVAQTMGLPEEIEGEVLEGPVGFFSSGSMTAKGVIGFKTKEGSGAKVFGWQDDQWQEYPTEAEENMVTAQVDQLGTYVLVEP